MLNWLKKKGEGDGYKVREGGISTIKGVSLLFSRQGHLKQFPVVFLH